MDKEQNHRIGAVIIASFDWETDPMLPMMPLEGSTVIKHEIYTLRQAGISNIVVLGGYQASVLKNHLSHNNILFFEDCDYKNHTVQESFLSIWDNLKDMFDSVLLCSVLRPAFSHKTIKALIDQEEGAVPVYNDKMGFPLLCPMKKEVLDENCGIFQIPDHSMMNAELNGFTKVPVRDEGILLSIKGDGLQRLQEYINSRRAAKELHIKTKLIISKEQDFFGPGIYKLLMKIQETGSIQAAAGQMEMSYTKAWKMVNKIEKEMGFSFLKRVNGGKRGGSSVLTEEGLSFLHSYHKMEEELKRISQNLMEIYFQDYFE